MSSKREQVLEALFNRLSSLEDVDIRRNEAMPIKIPSCGLVILRDGNLGEPQILLSPTRYIFQHRAEVEVLMQKVSAADTDVALDNVLERIGYLITVDPTLSGQIDYMHAEPPEFIEQPIEGGITIKAAIIPIILEYVSKTSLN